ncbi:hypothetical protein E2562_010447 [Oryza meyeriana var. granulata]|uniref:Uncharacterized protein n=1 Tax=Oryza meyeriana var. granulata TaxID=110450 RepID=A0A6G1F6M3_9ORYZ|nr:hypothetical protein E2562_010447 [Oryza meyeriana var. granulata]
MAMPTMRKVAVAMLVVVMAMSGSWTPGTARPYAEQHSAGGYVNIALPPATQWRGGHRLPPLEQKLWHRRCPISNDPNNC